MEGEIEKLWMKRLKGSCWVCLPVAHIYLVLMWNSLLGGGIKVLNQ